MTHEPLVSIAPPSIVAEAGNRRAFGAEVKPASRSAAADRCGKATLSDGPTIGPIRVVKRTILG
jgi:hypothetical protein